MQNVAEITKTVTTRYWSISIRTASVGSYTQAKWPCCKVCWNLNFYFWLCNISLWWLPHADLLTWSLHTDHDAVLCRYASEVHKYHRKSWKYIKIPKLCSKNHRVNKEFVHSLRKHYFENQISVLPQKFTPEYLPCWLIL